MTTFEDVMRELAADGDVAVAFCEPSKHGEPGVLLCLWREGSFDGLHLIKDFLIIEDPAES